LVERSKGTSHKIKKRVSLSHRDKSPGRGNPEKPRDRGATPDAPNLPRVFAATENGDKAVSIKRSGACADVGTQHTTEQEKKRKSEPSQKGENKRGRWPPPQGMGDQFVEEVGCFNQARGRRKYRRGPQRHRKVGGRKDEGAPEAAASTGGSTAGEGLNCFERRTKLKRRLKELRRCDREDHKNREQTREPTTKRYVGTSAPISNKRQQKSGGIERLIQKRTQGAARTTKDERHLCEKGHQKKECRSKSLPARSEKRGAKGKEEAVDSQQLRASAAVIRNEGEETENLAEESKHRVRSAKSAPSGAV